MWLVSVCGARGPLSPSQPAIVVVSHVLITALDCVNRTVRIAKTDYYRPLAAAITFPLWTSPYNIVILAAILECKSTRRKTSLARNIPQFLSSDLVSCWYKLHLELSNTLYFRCFSHSVSQQTSYIRVHARTCTLLLLPIVNIYIYMYTHYTPRWWPQTWPRPLMHLLQRVYRNSPV